MIYDRAQNTEKSAIFVPNIDVIEIARVFFVFFFSLCLLLLLFFICVILVFN